ncbi:uncharacterized protein LAESUDRAFT_749833 [Laetiporus sulphureus 93-53]|uniref:N-acetyltransferase domain-containing protein n=1 Tax=Laetiporus sulphureus 93-53 TaxID=1314785 RepID=A0A165EF71_9APHY|nr:uncharacterized protein LAESUDRAFT_749833 [Laetiporus sulphureus 93-53]KZT06924.1 hypothetical protein LAESUDRAFT_749833 [Laetiporus sulphureus 93-53]
MAMPVARIRPFQPSDEKLVHFMIGKANMDALAVANRQAYFHPLILALWVGLSATFVQVMGWWPDAERGSLGWVRPIPAFACIAVPLMFLCDWFNRSTFEDQTQDILHRPDVADIASYYLRSPSSGFWLLEYGDNFVGLIAVDASPDSTSNKTLSELASSRQKNQKIDLKKGTSETAAIRHFYVEEQYRRAGMQHDLLAHAVKHVFSSSQKVKTISAVDSPLKPYVGDALRQQGFELERKTEKVGILRWQNTVRVLSREHWRVPQE